MSRSTQGMASLTVGSGEPLLLIPGLTPDHRPPRGADRLLQLQQMRRLAERRQVWWVNRRQGLRSGTTMADLAGDYATVLDDWGDAPMDVVGMSTGGSIALQLAADHPELVRRLVLVAAACRLGEGGRAGQRAALEALEGGDRRHAAAVLMRLSAATSLTSRLYGAVGWVVPGPVVGRGDPDLLETVRAEDAFDLTGRLPAIGTPTLVIGGDRDAFYSAALFRETALGLARGHLVLHPGEGHAGVMSDRRLGAEVSAFLGQG